MCVKSFIFFFVYQFSLFNRDCSRKGLGHFKLVRVCLIPTPCPQHGHKVFHVTREQAASLKGHFHPFFRSADIPNTNRLNRVSDRFATAAINPPVQTDRYHPPVTSRLCLCSTMRAGILWSG